MIDWIEHIPFTETRNYVMRVAESPAVYAQRIAGPPDEQRVFPLNPPVASGAWELTRRAARRSRQSVKSPPRR